MNSVTIYSPFATVSYGHNRDYTSGLCRGFQALGYDVSIVSVPGEGAAATLVDRLLQQTHRYPTSVPLRAIREAVLMARTVRAARRRQGLVVFESFEYLLLAISVKAICRSSSVSIIVHNVGLGHDSRGLSRAYWWLARLAMRRASNSPAKLFAHGDLLADVLENSLGLSATVQSIPYGIEVESFSAPSRPDARARRALMFGTWRTDKLLRMAIEAFADPPVGWQLLIAGPEGNIDRPALEAMIAEHNAAANVVVDERFLDRDAQEAAFAPATVVLCLYDANVAHHSGTLNLAKQWIRPVVACGPPAITEQVREEMLGLVIGDSAEELRSALRRFESSDVIEHYYTSIRDVRDLSAWPSVAARLISEAEASPQEIVRAE